MDFYFFGHLFSVNELRPALLRKGCRSRNGWRLWYCARAIRHGRCLDLALKRLPCVPARRRIASHTTRSTAHGISHEAACVLADGRGWECGPEYDCRRRDLKFVFFNLISPRLGV